MITLVPLNKDLTYTKGPLVYMTGKQVVGSALQDFSARLPEVILPGYSRGYKNPDWRNKVQQKKDATTPLEVRVDFMSYENINSTWSYNYKGYGPKLVESRVFSALPTPQYVESGGVPPSQIDTNWSCYKEARNIALTYRSQYVAEATQPFQSQVFLGEIKETLEFIRHPFAKLSALANSASVARYNAAIKAYRQAAIKHRGGVFARTSQARLLLNDVADAWFEVRFAFLPLVQDITSAFSAVNGRSSVRRSSFRGDAKQAVAPLVSRWDYPRFFNGNRVTTGEISCKYFINTGIIFDDSTNYNGFAEYLEKSSLELTNFIPTVWELTPGSWLVDYFVNVGDILNSIATSSKVTMQYDCRTAVVDYVKQCTWQILPGTRLDNNIQILSEGPLASTTRTRRYVSRTVGTDSFPSVTFRLPTGMSELANTSLYLSRKFFNVFK